MKFLSQLIALVAFALTMGGLSADETAEDLFSGIVGLNSTLENPPPPPVVLSARKSHSKSTTEQAIEIKLAIGAEMELYSERQHSLLLPLKIVLLDENSEPIKTKLSFPTPKKMELDEGLGGEFYVYRGDTRITAKCAADANPTHVRLFYHGYHTRGY